MKALIKILSVVFLIFILIFSLFNVLIYAADSSYPTLSYWETVFQNIKFCTYYEYLDVAPPGESTDPNFNNSKPVDMNYLYSDGDIIVSLNPFDIGDLEFYDSNYNVSPYNAAFYFDLPLNLRSGDLSFSLTYSADGYENLNYYIDLLGEYHYFMSFNDLVLNQDTLIECYAYDSLGNYRLCDVPDFMWYGVEDSVNGNYFTFFFNFYEITDLSYLKIVVKTVTPERYQSGGTTQFICGRIPYYQSLKLSQDFIYIPPTYEDKVIAGIEEISDQLDVMIFPTAEISGDVNEVEDQKSSVQNKVDDLNTGLELDAPASVGDVSSLVSPYFNIMNFDYIALSIGRFWNASVVMRLLMMVGFFAFMSFILFGKK